MRKFFVICLLLAVFVPLALAKTEPLLWDMTPWQNARVAGRGDSLYQACVKQADIYLRHATPSVMDKPHTWSGDMHNFESVAPYYWPNPDDPNGKYIVRDGEVNPDYGKYDRRRIDQLAQRVTAFALAYYLTRERKYAEGFMKDIHIWFLDDSSRMNPHFQYAQIKPTYTKIGVPAGIIEGYNLIEILDAFRLMESLGAMPAAERKSLRVWCSALAEWLATSENGRKEAEMPNNHSTAYDVLLYDLCQYCGKKAMARRVANGFGKKRVLVQINERGEQPEELKRTVAYKYSIYNVTHIIDFYYIRRNLGYRDFRQYEKRISSAIDYLYAFIGHRENFKYQQISDWELNEKDCQKQYDRWQKLLKK